MKGEGFFLGEGRAALMLSMAISEFQSTEYQPLDADLCTR